MESYKCGHPPFVWTSWPAEDPGQVRNVVVGMVKWVEGRVQSKGGWDTAECQTRGCSSELAGQALTPCTLCLGLVSAEGSRSPQ